MSFLDFFTGKRAKQTNIQLEALVQTLKAGELEKVLAKTCNNLEALSSSIKNSGALPIPVQTFPTSDDFRFEKEKQETVYHCGKRFAEGGSYFIEKLNTAHQPVENAMGKFFSLLDEYTRGNRTNADSLGQALGESLYCSPKRVVAAFQKQSLEAGWAFVCNFNRLIDELAKEFPRCRGGIFASRLNYSDVLQISEEVLATLRATSTMLDDVQRRHDLLEALQGELISDLQSEEIKKIWNAISASFKDSLNFSDEQDGFFKSMFKNAAGVGAAPVAWAMAVISAPQAQFQGQLAREQRIRVFLATSLLLRNGWGEWSQMSQEIVIPNLKVMFALKCDFVANRLLSVTDLITMNGYSLEGLPGKIQILLTNKSL